MNDSVIDIFSLCRFFFKFGGNLTGRWYLHSPPSGKEGWLKAGVVGRYTMLIITDLRIHLPPPPAGTPPSWRRRMLNTIDYQIIIFLINFTTKFEEESVFCFHFSYSHNLVAKCKIISKISLWEMFFELVFLMHFS